MILPNTKIAPLREDLDRILTPSFLTSTPFKRWIVGIEFADQWDKCLSIAKEDLRGTMIMGSNMEAYAHDAFTIVLNHFYQNEIYDNLMTFIAGALKAYVDDKGVYIDLDNIKKDLQVANVGEEYINRLDAIYPTDQKDEERIENEADKVRALEKRYAEYLSRSEANSKQAIEAYLDWHSAAVIYLSQYYSSANSDFQKIKDLDNSGNGNSLCNNYHSIRTIYNLLMQNAERNIPSFTNKRSPMIFISHSSKDKEFVEAMVDLLECIGLDQSNIFCSSVEGYGVRFGSNIFDTLRDLYIEHDLYVIFVHSPRYYTSHVSLNEMGAAWVLRTQHRSFHTKDMTFDKMTGVINGQELSLKVDSENAASLLIEFKNSLIEFFGLRPVDEQKWARKSRLFLNAVCSIDVKNDSKEDTDIDDEYKRLQVEKLRMEAEDRKKAVIRGNIIHGAKAGNRELKLYNAGKCEAKEVKVEWLNPSKEVLLMHDFSSLGDLTPQNGRTFRMALCIGAPDTMNLRYTWKDDYSDNNVYEETLQL